MDNLSPKQKEALQKIKDLARLGKPVTLKELKNAMGYKTKNVTPVQRHIKVLKDKMYLEDVRGISVKKFLGKIQIPVVGSVSCGQPILAIENINAYIPFDSVKIKGSVSDYFFLKASGTSMNKTNINGKTIDDGDFVLIKKQMKANPGERILALIGDEATIKLLEKGDGCMILQPESDDPLNKPIYLFEDFSVQGIVQDVIKKGN